MKATQPCPCGWKGLSAEDCLCTKNLVDRNLAKISGPLLDRIDLHVPVPACNARAGALWNAQIRARDLPLLCSLTSAAQRALEAAMTRLELSVRARDRVIKVARSIADLAGKDQIDVEEVAEAVTYRCLDRAE